MIQLHSSPSSIVVVPFGVLLWKKLAAWLDAVLEEAPVTGPPTVKTLYCPNCRRDAIASIIPMQTGRRVKAECRCEWDEAFSPSEHDEDECKHCGWTRDSHE